MRAPSCNSCDSKNRSVELQRKIEHGIGKSAVKIYVGTDAFVDFAFFRNYLWGKAYHERVERKFYVLAFFLVNTFDEGMENNRTRVRKRIYGMSHTINQTCMVKSFFI